MGLVRSAIAALSCFSAIPMPFVEWDERGMRHMLAAFPLVGVVVGALCALWGGLSWAWGTGPFLRGAVFALVPLVVTGGIHLDGFADVVDAVSSHASPERRRQILKDPHVGAFAAMGVSAYLLLSAALASELEPEHLLAYACVPVASRCVSGLASLCWPLAAGEGMLATVVRAADRRGSLCALAATLAATAVLAGVRDPVVEAAALAAASAVALWVRRLALRDFGGMSGDLSGFLLQAVELAMAACVVLVGRLV